MKAQILYGIGNLNIADIEKPSPKEGEALVRVTRCGICGSDVPRVYKTGAHNMPLIPGHEFCGVVEKCDSDERYVGKRVGVFPLIPCRTCSQCKEKHYEMCENYNYLGSRSDGGFAEYVTVPLWNLLPLPDEVGDDEAAMLEPMAVAVHAIRRIGLSLCDRGALKKSEKAKTIVVCGLGTIGLMVAMFLRDAGYHKVLLIGNKTVQKEKALKMGYAEEDYCDVRYGDPVNFIMSRTGELGADYYFECIGRTENYAQALKCMAPMGAVMLVGNPYSDMELPKEVYWKILRGQLTIKGTWNSSYLGPAEGESLDEDAGKKRAPMDDWRYVIYRISSLKKMAITSGSSGVDGDKKERNVFLPDELITHRFTLSDMQEGLRIMQKKSEEYIKIMIDTSLDV